MKLSLTTIGSRYGSVDALNANFDAIELAFDDILSRSGESPNFMEANLDMNGFSLLNVLNINGADVSSLLGFEQAVSNALVAASEASASAVAAASSASSALSSANAAAASALLVEDAKLIWKGAWSNATAYEVNDAVVEGGTSYICILAHTNQQPPNASYWDVLAQRGADGAAGTGSGDVSSNTAVSVDNELALFDGVSGKLIKRATSNGIPKLTSGVLGTAVAGTDYLTPTDITNMLETTDIGVSVQAYDVDTAKTDVTQTFTAPQRGSITSDNDLSFDLSAGNYFSCTPTAGGTLTFTNIATGQSGHILLTNNSNYAITAHANTKINSADLSAISATGVFLLAYFSTGTNVYVTVSRSFA